MMARCLHRGKRGIVFIDGERFPKVGSEWGNPYKGDDAVSKYEQHLNEMLEDEECRNRFLLLKGKTLGCWCKIPGKEVKCHGDVIVRKLNEM